MLSNPFATQMQIQLLNMMYSNQHGGREAVTPQTPLQVQNSPSPPPSAWSPALQAGMGERSLGWNSGTRAYVEKMAAADTKRTAPKRKSSGGLVSTPSLPSTTTNQLNLSGGSDGQSSPGSRMSEPDPDDLGRVSTSASPDGPVHENSSSGRKTAGTNAAAEKDSAYMARRRKNNLAAKKSRDNRKRHEAETAKAVLALEQENRQLKADLAGVNAELNRMKDLFMTSNGFS